MPVNRAKANAGSASGTQGPHLPPDFLARALGKKFPPTEEQARVIDGEFGPKLVVAGAGAGKTETMASRVVSLVANGHVRPEQVLGLTFTRKAAQQLAQRIRHQLIALRDTGLFAPGGPVAQGLETIVPTVSTYDSFAGDLVREFGLLVPVEPSARIITEAERFAIAHEVVLNYGGTLTASQSVSTVTETLLALTNAMDNALANPEDIREHARNFRLEAENLEPTRKNGPAFSKEVEKYLAVQQLRVEYLPLVEALKAEQAARKVVTFGEQMSIAATLAERHPQVGQVLRQRFSVVMLDEYQDTSHAQRILLRSLFGNGPHEGLSVTAVGDPMQAIYGWRGATAENLAAFVEDFPQTDGSDAPKDQLTTSWRNPAGVLEMANIVAGDVFGTGPRPVDELAPRPGAERGDVKLGYFATAEEELEFVTSHLSALYQESLETGKGLSAAVLVRANRHSAQMAAYLEEAGVPHEIVGLGGLLWEPEVQDVVAVATMLIRPGDTDAALRVLSGPLCGIGIADIMALKARADNLAGSMHHEPPAAGPESAGTAQPGLGDPALDHLAEQLAELTAEGPDQVVGLTDAVADLGERERYTPEGLARIEELSARLRYLRSYSLAKPLADLFADIEAVFNVRTECLARGGAVGTAHLDALLDTVAGYHGDSLGGLLDYFALAREREDGLDPGEVPAAADRVLIMTAHKAKGLEWEHVCVLHTDSATYKAQAKTFITTVEQAPGDEDHIELDPDATKRSEFGKACKRFIEQNREHNAEETARLFYVALTRTESTLTITGSGTNNAKGASKKGPYRYLEMLAKKYPDCVVEWTVPEKPVEAVEAEEAGAQPDNSAGFPALQAHSSALRGAALVSAAMGELPELRAGEQFHLWEQDASALIEEYRQLQSPVVEVELSAELTASDVVAIGTDPVAYARRQRRPVPFKPNSYAKRGTAFHSWLEDRFGGNALLGMDELPGMDEEPAADLEALKEAFLASPWADRTPAFVEAPFEFSVGRAVLRGRMDAVFREPDGSWLIVDWKTGRAPQGRDLANAELQLAVYREAWRRLRADGAPVRAAFHYVSQGYTLEPRSLPSGEDLRGLLEAAISANAPESG